MDRSSSSSQKRRRQQEPINVFDEEAYVPPSNVILEDDIEWSEDEDGEKEHQHLLNDFREKHNMNVKSQNNKEMVYDVSKQPEFHQRKKGIGEKVFTCCVSN